MTMPPKKHSAASASVTQEEGTPVGYKRSPLAEQMSGWIKNQLSEPDDPYERFKGKGEKIGLSGEALAKFVVESVRNEEERRRQEKKDEEERRLREEECRRQEKKDEEERRRQEKKDEEERRSREDECRFRERQIEIQERKEDEELRLRVREIEIRELEVAEKLKLKEREVETQESRHIHLEPLGEKDDVDAYINHFERVATMCHWKEASWSARLVSLLRGGARDAVLRLSQEDLASYPKVKSALLTHFRLDAEAYQKKFRTMRKEPSETFSQFLVRLKTCFSLWCTAAEKDMKSADDIIDLVLQEQFYQILSPEMITEARRANPVDVEGVAKEATLLAEAKRMGREARIDKDSKGRPGSGVEEERVPSPGQNRGEPASPLRREVFCYDCKKAGHIARHCPQPQGSAVVRGAPQSQRSTVAGRGFQAQRLAMVGCGPQPQIGVPPTLCAPCAEMEYIPKCTAHINRVPVTALRDTGAGFTIVSRELVPQEAYTGKTETVVFAEADSVCELPVAIVHLESPFISRRIEVLVMAKLVEEVLIGNFARREGSQELVRVPVYADPALVHQVPCQEELWERRKGPSPVLETVELFGVSEKELERLQRRDPSLQAAHEACNRGEKFYTHSGIVSYKRKGGVLVRHFVMRRRTVVQVCVPKCFRREAMRSCHERGIFGHSRARVTKHKMFRKFYWPGMCSDINRFCQSCDLCILSSVQREWRGVARIRTGGRGSFFEDPDYMGRHESSWRELDAGW